MKLYLDNCMFNRPFDDQSNIKILLESEAKLRIQQDIRSGVYELVWSYVLDYENNKNPFQEKKEQISKWKLYACTDLEEDQYILELAKSIHQLGFKKFDALHLACAITASANYFLTTDTGIIKKARLVETICIKDPVDFVRENSE